MVGFTVFTALLARMGEDELAAHQIAIKIVSLSFLPGYGMSEAASVLTGQYVGAGKPEHARRSFATAMWISIAIMGVFGMIFWLVPDALIGLFQNDARSPYLLSTTQRPGGPMAKEPIPTWYFSLVIVRLGHRFLLVRERKHGQKWYLPAGRVEPGETLAHGAIRETLEEAGIPIALEGILRVEHSPQPGGAARCRVFYLARPTGDTPPKSEPDDESLEARWVTLEEAHTMDLRGREVIDVFKCVERGATIHPLGLICWEGAPWA